MKFVSTAQQSRELDRRVIDGLSLPGIALMELAAKGVADAIARWHGPEARRGTVVVCGPGNNGGDGYAVARWLKGWGWPVQVVALGSPRPGTDAEVMAGCARVAGVPIHPAMIAIGGEPPGLWVDALFGTGLARELSAEATAAVEAMTGAPVVAVDLPSGLDADSGRVWGAAPRADTTVTFGRVKLGMVTGRGGTLCGRIEVVDLGLGAGTPLDGLAAAEIPEVADLAPLWPRRAPDAHKTRSGHLLLVAGSAAMTGAAVLAARGALAAGAGLVTLAAPRGALARLAALPPEVMWWVAGEGDHTDHLPALDRFTAVAAGPGLGGGAALSPALEAALVAWWRTSALPLVYDADALPATRAPETGAPRVLTPHRGEAARLLELPIGEIDADPLDTARALSDRGVALLKGRPTVIAAAGHRPSLNPTGGPALASGGTGDVLTGVVGALLARGVEARDAARLAAWVHGSAGDRLGARRLEGWTASDVASAIPEGVHALIGGASGEVP